MTTTEPTPSSADLARLQAVASEAWNAHHADNCIGTLTNYWDACDAYSAAQHQVSSEEHHRRDVEALAARFSPDDLCRLIIAETVRQLADSLDVLVDAIDDPDRCRLENLADDVFNVAGELARAITDVDSTWDPWFGLMETHDPGHWWSLTPYGLMRQTENEAHERLYAQAVIVHLPAPQEEFWDYDERQHLTEAIGSAGVYDGWEISIPDGAYDIYMYGPDADAVWAAVEPVLRDAPLGPGAHATIHYGSLGDAAPTRRIEVTAA